MASSGDITVLLRRLSSGDSSAECELLPHVYQELKKLAKSHLRRERVGHTLQTTALVHEAWMRMAGLQGLTCEDCIHFFRLSAKVMRRVLVDHARHSNAKKRGEGWAPVLFEEGMLISEDRLETVLAVNEALERFEKMDPRGAQVVVLRYFSGMTEEEIALALQISIRTVKRDWEIARAWLLAELTDSRTRASTSRAS